MVKKTTEHLEAEKNLRGHIREELKMAKKELVQVKEKIQSQKNHPNIVEKEKSTRYV